MPIDIYLKWRSAHWLAPIYEALHRQLLQRQELHADVPHRRWHQASDCVALESRHFAVFLLLIVERTNAHAPSFSLLCKGMTKRRFKSAETVTVFTIQPQTRKVRKPLEFL
ncbi:MAG: hypothetical protein RSB39_03985, partial [Oscillospiraceae bacterium]